MRVDRFAPINEPQLAGDSAGIEEIGADRDHHVHVARLDDLLAHLLRAMPALDAWEDMTNPARPFSLR